MMEIIKEDYGDIELDAENIQKTLGDQENLAFLKDVMDKLG